MICRAYYAHFIEHHVSDARFVRMAKAMGLEQADKAADFLTALEQLMADCGVFDLKMSDYGIAPAEFPMLAQKAKDTMGKLFQRDPITLSLDDCVKIFEKSYR